MRQPGRTVVGASIFVPATPEGQAPTRAAGGSAAPSTGSRKAKSQKRSKKKSSKAKKLLRAWGQSFAFPFRGHGKWVMLGWTTIFALGMIASAFFAMVAVLVLAILTPLMLIFLAHIAAFLVQVLRIAASGDDEFPRTSLDQEVVRDLLYLIVSLLAGFGPLLWYFAFVKMNGIQIYSPIAHWACIAFGVFYTPMCLLAVTLMDSIAAANPLTVLAAVAKIPFQYASSCLFIAAIIVVQEVIKRSIPENPLLTGTLNWFISLYAALVAMHLLGSVYYLNRKRIGWFRHAPRGV